jgi:flagellar biosynthesis protein FlhA
MRTLTRRSIPKLSILSVNEIPMNIDLRSYDIVTFDA